MTHRRTSLIVILVILYQYLLASPNLHYFVQQVTEATVLDHYYQSLDPLWDPLKFHQGKTREEGTGGHDSVMVYLQEQLVSYLGEDYVYVHEFPWTDGTNGKGYNIIGVKPGRLGDNSDIWIVGAHYDSYDMNATGVAPGANDNGSGMSGLLEIVRAIGTRESDATIIYGFWDAEEPRYAFHAWVSGSAFGSDPYSGPSGSRAWINDHFTMNTSSMGTDTLLWDRVRGNINLDMFGYPGVDNTVWLYHGGSAWNSSIDATENIYPLSHAVDQLYLSANRYLTTYGYDDNEPQGQLIVIEKGTMQYSDNISFSRAGIPSLEYAESGWNSDPYYHQWSDYFRNVNGDEYFAYENPKIGFMTMVIRGVLALLADTAGVDINTDIPTPVEILDFQAMSDQACVYLKWSTASETENLGFLIEKRKTGDRDWQILTSCLTNSDLAGYVFSTDISNYCVSDSSVSIGDRYEYRLSEVGLNGKTQVLKTTSVIFKGDNRISGGRVFPNPFNPSVMIRYDVPAQAEVDIKVFDLYGRQIETLLIGEDRFPGTYDLIWHAGDKASGPYLILICLNYENDTQTTHVFKAILEK